MNAIAERNVQVNDHSPREASLRASMNMRATGGALQLHESQPLHMRDACGWTIEALHGIVWITQESDSRDIVLRQGQSFKLDRAGSALVSSLGDADIVVRQMAVS